MGNVFSDTSIASKYRRTKSAGNSENLYLARVEMERVRLRRKTDKGTDVALVMEPGTSLQHGDVLLEDRDKFIVVMQLPEKVMRVRITEKSKSRLAEAWALVGHAIGNRHRPISVEDGAISFPVMGESELATFEQLFAGHNIKLGIEEKVFFPIGSTGGTHHQHGH